MKKLLLILLCFPLILLIGCDSNMLSNYSKIFLKNDKESIVKEPESDAILEILVDSLQKDTIKEEEVLLPPPPPPPFPQIIDIVDDEVEIENEIEIEDTELDEDVMIEIEEDDEVFFMVVENMPEFPGGDLGLMKFIQKNLKYPPIAKEYNITGKVYISFIVDKSGLVTNVKIVRGVDKNLDVEAMRVVKSLPKYKPGKQRGKAVRVMFTIPINFTLN